MAPSNYPNNHFIYNIKILKQHRAELAWLAQPTIGYKLDGHLRFPAEGNFFLIL
jgi:hypothetical protein